MDHRNAQTPRQEAGVTQLHRPADPIDCPTWRKKMFDDVAAPRSSQFTAPWVEMTKTLLIMPKPSPSSTMPPYATAMFEPALSVVRIRLPASIGIVPARALVR